MYADGSSLCLTKNLHGKIDSPFLNLITLLLFFCHIFFGHLFSVNTRCFSLDVLPKVCVPAGEYPSAAADHPALHGPADHLSHRQQEGTQTQGTVCFLKMVPPAICVLLDS